MKTNMVIQISGNDVSYADILSRFKELWKNRGKKIKDIKTLNLYYNVNDNRVYYVVNEKETGSI